MKNYIRELAKSDNWQLLYTKSKDISSIQLFNNIKNFSKIQLTFLYWLTIYNSAYQDLASKEKYLTKEVIEDTIEFDAYLYYKSQNDSVKESIKKDKKISKIPGIPSLVRRVK